MHLQRFQDSNERRDWQLLLQVIYFVNKREAMLSTGRLKISKCTWIKCVQCTSLLVWSQHVSGNWKSRCEMLIGGDDISNDFITLGTCLHSLSFPLRADRQKSDSSVDGDPQGSWRWNSNCRDVAASSLSFSRPTARAPWSAWLKNCSDVWTRVHQCRTWRLLEVGHPNYTMHLLPYCGKK